MQQKQISSKKLDLDKNPFYDFQYFLLQVEDTISERRKLAVVLGQRSFVLLPRQLLSKMKENFTRKVFCIFGYKSSVNNHLKGTQYTLQVGEQLLKALNCTLYCCPQNYGPHMKDICLNITGAKQEVWETTTNYRMLLKTHQISLLQDFLQKRKYFCCVILSFRDIIR